MAWGGKSELEKEDRFELKEHSVIAERNFSSFKS